MIREVYSLTKRSLKNSVALLPCAELNGGAYQFSILTRRDRQHVPAALFSDEN